MRKRLQCTLCAERFVWTEDGFPDECPVCHQYIGVSGKPEVAAPMIALRAKSVDSVYRAMERGSEHRMNVASEFLGIPKSELSDMKITNMRDNAKVGEDSAPPLSRSAAQLMEWNQKQAAGPQLPDGITNMAYGAGDRGQQARQNIAAAADSAHPKSGVGTGIGTLAQLRSSHLSRLF